MEDSTLKNISGSGDSEEPYVGMEFETEGAARDFYAAYARRTGFVVRVMQRRRSGIDGKTLARRLGCNKQGFSPSGTKGSAISQEKKPRPRAREGCKATILVKMEKCGKWVVTRFVKEHNHPLVVVARGFSDSALEYLPGGGDLGHPHSPSVGAWPDWTLNVQTGAIQTND